MNLLFCLLVGWMALEMTGRGSFEILLFYSPKHQVTTVSHSLAGLELL